MNKNIFGSGLIIFIVLIFDRLSKIWALTLNEDFFFCSNLSCGLTFNRGINWGFFNSDSTISFIFINCLIALVIISLFFYAYHLYQIKKPFFSYSLILAGALSNFYDRIFYSGVIDFIMVSYRSLQWPAFNVADVLIVSGIGLLLLNGNKS